MPNLSPMEYASKGYSNRVGHLLSLPKLPKIWPVGRGFYPCFKFEKFKAPLSPGPRGAWIQMTGA